MTPRCFGAAPELVFVVVASITLTGTAEAGAGFIENRGQWSPDVVCASPDLAAGVQFLEDGFVLRLLGEEYPPETAVEREGDGAGRESDLVDPGRSRTCSVLRARLTARTGGTTVELRGPTTTRHNFFVGDPSDWRTGVAAFAEVVYRDVRPGVDVVFRAVPGGLSYEVVGAADDTPALVFEGATGITEAKDGSRRIETAADVLWHQEAIPGVAAGFVTIGSQRRDVVAKSDPGTLTWSTTLGIAGDDQDAIFCSLLTEAGEYIVGGKTYATSFPTTPGSYQEVSNGRREAFLTKFDPSGSTLVWSTYLGGSGNEAIEAVAFGPQGDLFLAGYTESSDFPVTGGAYDTTANGGADAFIAKLGSGGDELHWCSLIGGNSTDTARGVQVDASGQPVICGYSYNASIDYPTTPGAYDTTHSIYEDVFVTKFTADGSDLVWSTYVGGGDNDFGRGMVLDSAERPVVVGYSEGGFPTTAGAYDPVQNNRDAFVFKLSSDGSALVWSTVLGGTGWDYGYAVALDAVDNPVITGFTDSSNFPTTPGAMREADAGGRDAFVSKFSMDGARLLWSTYLGGEGTDTGYCIDVDDHNCPVVGGFTGSWDFPATPDGYADTYQRNADGFVARIAVHGDAVEWGTFLPGFHDEPVHTVVAAADGAIFAGGDTDSYDFPTTPGSFDPVPEGYQDGFALRLDPPASAAGAVALVTPDPDLATPGHATPIALPVAWTNTGVDPLYWEIEMSFDGGAHYRVIDRIADPAARTAALEIPPVSTTQARLRVSAVGYGGETLASDRTTWDLQLIQENRIYFDAPWRDAAGGWVRDIGIVLTWPRAEDAERYKIEIEESGRSSCGDWSRTYYLDPDPHTGDLPTAWAVPTADLQQMPAARYLAKVYRVRNNWADASLFEGDFLLCRLVDDHGDLSRVPVVLVHGWMSDNGTWFMEGGSSPLMARLLDAGYRVLTFDYPNIDGIEPSGAALGEALRIALAEALDGTDRILQAHIVAHSMGGLVSRTYLQSAAEIRVDAGTTGYAPYRGDVGRFVTLATPHLGEMGTKVASALKEFPGCPGVLRSESHGDIDNTGDLIETLSGRNLPDGLECLFTVGTMTDSDQEKMKASSEILESGCRWVNDGVVSACSASGGDRVGLVYETWNTGSTAPLVEAYALGHGEMSLPGQSFSSGGKRHTASARLLADVVSFLDDGTTDDAYARGVIPAVSSASLLQVGVVGAGGTMVILKQRYGDTGAAPAVPVAKSAADIEGAVVGAQITVRDAAQAARGGGLVHAAGPNGLADLRLAPGSYEMEVAADGYVTRVQTFAVADSLDSYLWDVVLEPTAGTFRHPSVVIEAGAAVTSDTMVAVDLSCEGAVEYQLAHDPLFTDAVWTVMEPSATWVLEEGEGPRTIFARFRDGAGNVGATVEDGILLGGATTGSLTVMTLPTGAEIHLDGAPTGLLSPARIDSVVPGYYYVSVTMDGYAAAPVIATVEVGAGINSVAGFTLTELPPPPPVAPASLGASDFLSGAPFVWSVPAAWPEGVPLFYDLMISTDAAQDSLVFGRTSLTEPTVGLGDALADSQQYYVAIASRDIHGTVQADPPAVRAFQLDHTPPVVSLTSPSPGDTLFPGAPLTLVTAAEDWSGVASCRALFSPDAGAAWPDTLWEGAWSETLDTSVPVYALADSCLILIAATDAAGNVGTAVLDPFLVVSDGVTAVGEDDPAADRFSFAIAGGNPQSSSTRFAVAVPPGTRARIAVYDLRGRRVHVVHDGLVPSGRTSVTWDGRDSRGRRAAAGIYLATMENEGRLAVRKITIVR